MAITLNVAPSLDGSNYSYSVPEPQPAEPHEHTGPLRCRHCGVVPTPKKQRACAPVQLRLAPWCLLQIRLRRFLFESQLPQDEFAVYGLGRDPATLYRYLHGGVIPEATADRIRSIEHVSREGNYLHIICRVPDRGHRWSHMLYTRKRKHGVTQDPVGTA